MGVSRRRKTAQGMRVGGWKDRGPPPVLTKFQDGKTHHSLVTGYSNRFQLLPDQKEKSLMGAATWKRASVISRDPETAREQGLGTISDANLPLKALPISPHPHLSHHQIHGPRQSASLTESPMDGFCLSI